MTTQSASFVLPSAPAPRQTPQLPPPIDPSKAQAARQRENERRLREARRVAKHECELMAVEHAKAMMERDLFQAIELEKTDPALAAKLRGRILDRGIGKPPEADAEAAQRRRGGNVNDLTDFLHAISAASNAVAGISHQPVTPAPERDVTPVEHDPDAQWFEGFAQQPDIEGEDHE